VEGRRRGFGRKDRLGSRTRARRQRLCYIAAERMDNTQTASMDIAIGKAKAAATFRRPTRVFMEVINKGAPATATLPGVFASPGGVPIMVDGKVSGAVGVSGVTGDQDEQCAKAGLGST
jgi:glc operon protein GlcG